MGRTSLEYGSITLIGLTQAELVLGLLEKEAQGELLHSFKV